MNQITKLDAAGKELPADSTDHAIVLIDGLYIDVRPRKAMPWDKAMAECSSVKLLDREWRSITVKELFARTDLTRCEPAFDPSLFPHFPEYGWIWTSTEDAAEKPEEGDEEPSSPVCAWGVSLYYGSAFIDFRDLVGLALPVCAWVPPAGQS